MRVQEAATNPRAAQIVLTAHVQGRFGRSTSSREANAIIQSGRAKCDEGRTGLFESFRFEELEGDSFHYSKAPHAGRERFEILLFFAAENSRSQGGI